MKVWTLQEIASLSPSWGFDSDFAEYVDYYGVTMEQPYIQANIGAPEELQRKVTSTAKRFSPTAYQYSSIYVANVFNVTLYGVLGFIILIGFAQHWILPSFPAFTAAPKLRTLWTKHITLSSTVGSRTADPVNIFGSRWTSIQIPPRLHGVMIGSYVAINFILLFTPYMLVVPNVYPQMSLISLESWPDIGYPFNQYVRYFSDRTGILAFGSTPLVILLSGRNNPVSFLTGASYSTLQIYHRWIARVTFTNAFLHSIGYTVSSIIYSVEYYKASFKELYWIWGVVATSSGACLVAFSIRRLRELCYEGFLIAHILGVIFWIIGSYYHVWYLEPTYVYLKWMYASVGLWVGERGLRLLRTLYLNVRVGRSKDTSRPHLAAEGTLIEDGSFKRLRITPASPWPAGMSGPGTYCFISSPRHNIWESHPFTITWPMNMPCSTIAADKNLVTDSSSASTTSGKNTAHSDTGDLFGSIQPGSFELLLKTHGGFTRKLAKSMSAPIISEEGSNAVRKLRIFVDGPYGSPKSLATFGTVVLVAGGSGISATISHLADISWRTTKMSSSVKRLHVIWAVKDCQSCHALLPYLKRVHILMGQSSLEKFAISIHCTGGNTIDEKEILTPFKSLQPLITTAVQSGRPKVLDFIAPVLQHAEEGICVSVCGPASLCDDTREAVKENLGRERGLSADQLVFQVESFTW